MSRQDVQSTLAALAFAAAAADYGMGLAGWIVPGLAAMVASLALLTIGLYLASAATGGDSTR